MADQTPRGRPPKYGEPTKRVHVHIPETTHAQLTAVANTNGISLGEVLVRAAAPLLKDPTWAGLKAPAPEPIGGEKAEQNSLVQLLDLWDNALNEGQADTDLVATLDIPVVRDLVMATASSASPDAMSRAVAGAEVRGFLPRGSAAMAGRIASPDDGAWLDGVAVGEGVELPGRLMALRSIMESAIADESVVGQARVNAGTLHAWASWLLGDRADARGELIAVRREDGDTALAGLLLQVIDVQQGR